MMPITAAAHWIQTRGELRVFSPAAFLFLSQQLFYEPRKPLLSQSRNTTTRACFRAAQETVTLFWCPSGCGAEELPLCSTVAAVICLQPKEGGDKWTANFLQVAGGRF